MAHFIDHFARWLRFNWMYFGSPPWDTGVTPPELVVFLASYPPGRAIDLGCGTGTNLVAMAKAGWQVTGVDFAVKAVRFARKRLAMERVDGEVRGGDVSRMDIIRGEYELVLDIGCYHGLPSSSRAAYRENLERILVKGGHFLWYAHWRKEGQPAATGILPDELSSFPPSLALVSRQDSQDRWGRPASWMIFQKMR